MGRFTSLKSTLKNLKKTKGEEIQVSLKNTDHYCFNLLRFLRINSYPTFTYNPLIKHHSLGKTKTDKKDAMTITRKLLGKQLFKTRNPMIKLKYATRNASKIRDDFTKQKVNYTRVLDILFPELAKFLGPPTTKQDVRIYAILKESITASILVM